MEEWASWLGPGHLGAGQIALGSQQETQVVQREGRARVLLPQHLLVDGQGLL